MAVPTDADSTDLLLEGDPTSSDERSGSSLHLSAEEIADARAALDQRLRVVHDELLGAPDEDADIFALLDALLAHLIETRDPRVAWIVLVCVSTVLPRIGDVEALVRRVATYDVLETRFWLLGHVLPSARERGLLHLRMRLAVRTTVVDVSFSATDEHNTGIQRVVRRTLPHWLDSHEVVPVAWTSFSGSLRSLSDREVHRLLEWNSARVGDEHSPATELVVPWDSTVVLAEVPSRASMCDPLAALGRYSGNRLTLIGYDAIPIVSAETVPIDMSDHFAKYLSVVKWAGSVAA
ncbi:MAG: hypothetical protein INR66_04000, partial [Gordonia polyisoprenivorans]|nr:hypothetical protein [Gordonia polyisoprenivorans]